MRGRRSIFLRGQAAEESGRERSLDHDPVSLPGDLSGFKELLEALIGKAVAGRVLGQRNCEVAGQYNQGEERGLLAGGNVVGGSDLFDFEIERAFERKGWGKAGDDDGVGG